MPEQVELLHLIAIAGVGGFLLSMANLYEESKKPKSERVPKDRLYWLFFMLWPLAGAFLAWLYALDGSSLRPLLAFSVGLSAPATIQAMINKGAGILPGLPPNAEPSPH